MWLVARSIRLFAADVHFFFSSFSFSANMLSRLLYRREAEKLLLLMRAIKRGREEEEGGVIIALICGAMWSLLSPGWITKLCMFASLQSLMWSRSREGCCRAGTKGKLCWSSLRLWPSGFPNTSVLLSSGCSKKQKKNKSMVSTHPLTFTAHERIHSGRRRGRLQRAKTCRRFVFHTVSRTNGCLKWSNFQ